MKTRLEALEHHREQAFLQLVAQEIDIRQTESSLAIIKPNEDTSKTQKLLEQRKARIVGIKKVLKVIEEMIKEERKEAKSGD